MTMNEGLQFITGGVIILIGLTGAYLISALAGYWKQKKEDILIAASANEKLQRIPFINYLIKRVLKVVDDVVEALNNTYKKELLSRTEDGKLTDEDKKALRDKAVSLVTTEVPLAIWDQLDETVGDINETLKTYVEKSVAAQKVGSSALQEYIKQEQLDNSNK